MPGISTSNKIVHCPKRNITDGFVEAQEGGWSMGWKAPLGHITVNTREGANIQVEMSRLKDGVLPDYSIDVSEPRIYSIKAGTEEQYICLNRFPYIDPNI